MESSSKPPDLSMAVSWPLAALLRLGTFESTVLMLFLGLLVWGVWKMGECSCNPPPTYFHTPALLIAFLLLYLGLSGAQISLVMRLHLPIEKVSRSNLLGWLTGRTLAKGFPFLIMLLSLAALPDYRSHYLIAGIILLVLWLPLDYHFKRYTMRFPALRFTPKARRRLLIASLNAVPISFFAYYALPSSIGCDCRSPVSSTKSNMHTLQTILETYAVDWGGVYPANLQALEKEARTPGRSYWNDFHNPCPNDRGRPKPLADFNQADFIESAELLGIRFDLKAGTSRCVVLYDVGPANGLSTRYWVYGTDTNARLIIDRNQIMTLTNS